MSIERRRALYEGRVQGVGFRFTAQHLAQGFPVSGFVRNLPDGRVELVAEGEPNDVSAFFNAVSNEMDNFIREVRVEPQPPGSPPLDGFSIRH